MVVSVQVDWEVKLFAVVAIYASVKALTRFIPLAFATLLFRAIFVIFHSWVFLLFQKTRANISKSSLSSNSKLEANKKTLTVFRGLLGKAAIVLVIHFKAAMLPPLLVSCAMGFFTIIESEEYLFTIRRNYPFLVEK